MRGERVVAEVRDGITYNRVDMVRPVLGVVELDQQSGPGDSVVVAGAGFVSSGPREGCLSGIGSERPGWEAPEVHREKSPGTGGGRASQGAQRHTLGREGTVEAGLVAGDDVIGRLVRDHRRRPLFRREGVQELEADCSSGPSGATAARPPSWTTAGLAPRNRGVSRASPWQKVAWTEMWWPSNRTPHTSPRGGRRC